MEVWAAFSLLASSAITWSVTHKDLEGLGVAETAAFASKTVFVVALSIVTTCSRAFGSGTVGTTSFYSGCRCILVVWLVWVG